MQFVENIHLIFTKMKIKIHWILYAFCCAGGKTAKNVQQLWEAFPKVSRNAGATARVAFCHLLPHVGFPKNWGLWLMPWLRVWRYSHVYWLNSLVGRQIQQDLHGGTCLTKWPNWLVGVEMISFTDLPTQRQLSLLISVRGKSDSEATVLGSIKLVQTLAQDWVKYILTERDLNIYI